MDARMSTEDFEELGSEISKKIIADRERSKYRSQFKFRSYDLPIEDDDEDDN